MSVVTAHIPRQRTTTRATHRAVPVPPARTAWGRTLAVMLLAGLAGILIQQALLEPLGPVGSAMPGIALASLIAWGGGR